MSDDRFLRYGSCCTGLPYGHMGRMVSAVFLQQTAISQKQIRFRRQVTPGDVLELECTILKQKGPVAVAEAKATVGGQLAVSAELTFALAKDL